MQRQGARHLKNMVQRKQSPLSACRASVFGICVASAAPRVCSSAAVTGITDVSPLRVGAAPGTLSVAAVRSMWRAYAHSTGRVSAA